MTARWPGPLLSLFDEITSSRTSWMDSALCTQMLPDLFFSDQGEDTRPAKRACRMCPVIAECRAYVMDLESGWVSWQRHGIWAGMTGDERWKADPLTGLRAAA